MSDTDMYSSVCVVCIYILYIVLLTQMILAALEVNLFKMPSANTPACTHTHTHACTHTHTRFVSFCEDCPHVVHVVNTLYIVSDFLWQICVVVLVILSKLTVDFSDKWLKLVCIWKRQMQNHLLQFLPKGVDYKNSISFLFFPCPPLLCSFFYVFTFFNFQE